MQLQIYLCVKDLASFFQVAFHTRETSDEYVSMELHKKGYNAEVMKEGTFCLDNKDINSLPTLSS